MKKLVAWGICSSLLILLNLGIVNAKTLSGYAFAKQGNDIDQKIAGALVEFKDTVTGKPVSVKIKTGVPIKDRKDAFYTISKGDIGRWEAEVKPGNYTVTISYENGGQAESYSLNFAPPITCDATTGYLNVKDCGAVGNGYNDDTLAIFYAVEEIKSKGGGRLFFPKGYYSVGGQGTQNILPIKLPSGITIEGVNGGFGGPLGTCRITLGSQDSPGIVNGKTLFKIEEDTKHITFRDIGLLAYNFGATGNRTDVPGSTAILAEGDYPESTIGILFQNMHIRGFDIGIDVKGCKPGSFVNGACRTNPSDPNSPVKVPWQFDQVKVDHVSFETRIGVRIDTENSDWNFTSSWFYMPPDNTPATNTSESSGSYALYLKRSGFIQINNTFGGGSVGGTFIYAAIVESLTIINSQVERVNNSIVYGRDYLPGEPTENDLGHLTNRIVIVGNQFGAPIKLRHRVSLVSTGNRYGPNTIQTSTSKVRIYSTGDKFCEDGLIPNNLPCPNPGISGPGTVVFATGYPAEISGSSSSNIEEKPTRFGLPVEISNAGGSTSSMLKVSGDTGSLPIANISSPNTNPTLLRIGQPNFFYDFRRSGDNGFLEIRGNQQIPFRGFTINGLLQMDKNTTFADITNYGNTVFNNQPVITDGAIVYCKDCAKNSSGICVQGTEGVDGAFAKRINGTWRCD